MKKVVSFLSLLILTACSAVTFTSCTFNVSMAHTQGRADDVIDDTASNTPTANIPVSMVPK